MSFEGEVKHKIYSAWLMHEQKYPRYKCVFGLIDVEKKVDIVTSPVVSWCYSGTDIIVKTRSGSLYHIVDPDDDFFINLKGVIGEHADV
ncbi:hypothetical protein POP12_236 [Pectobacterium phage POP12]|nr:hypothetical protein POP12_236 [Pectobacterium phage POP12]